MFYPKCLSRGTRVTPKTGDWIVDPRDKAGFYVPFQKCGDLTPGMWRAEAMKGINKLSLGNQKARNAAMVLFGWPAMMAMVPLLGGALGAAGGLEPFVTDHP